MARQERAIRTRRTILDAAAAVFDERGYTSATIGEILGRAGVTKGALYFHFASKEALARAVIAEMVQRWGDLRGQVSRSGVDPLEALLGLVGEVIRRLIEDPIARGGTRLLNDLPRSVQDAGGHYHRVERDVAALLVEAAQAGLLREGIDSALVARQIVALVTGHRRICDAIEDRQGLRQRIDEAWMLLLPTIATDEWLASWRAARP